MPRRGTAGSAGYDLFAMEDVKIYHGRSAIVNTGVRLFFDQQGYYGQIASRSGLGFKKDIIAFPGVIDPDYTGEIKIKLFSQKPRIKDHNGETFFDEIPAGTAIAQIVFIPYGILDFQQVCSFEGTETERGDKGFGSTDET